MADLKSKAKLAIIGGTAALLVAGHFSRSAVQHPTMEQSTVVDQMTVSGEPTAISHFKAQPLFRSKLGSAAQVKIRASKSAEQITFALPTGISWNERTQLAHEALNSGLSYSFDSGRINVGH